MNSKYCRMIRQIARQRGYDDKMAKRVRKQVQKFNLNNPTHRFIHSVFDTVEILQQQQQIDNNSEA